MRNDAYFLIEGGKALDLVRFYLSETARVFEQTKALLAELGVSRYVPRASDGTVWGVIFDGERHPDFTKPDRRGLSRPKRGTEWAKRFSEQKGYERPSVLITKAFGVPYGISYANEEEACEGFRRIGSPLNECGFLYLSADGPYAMWVPDVPAEVEYHVSRGDTVKGPALSFRMEFDGCRRIEPEEWDIIVAQHKLAEKRAAAEGKA